MKKIIFLLISVPILASSQSGDTHTKTQLTKVYTQAIGDFIKAANKKNKVNFDTLYFGKRVNGQEDDFPDIKLPELIEKTQIRLVSPEVGATKQKEKDSRIYINLIAWVNNHAAEFIFVVFSNGFSHQYDYTISYTYNQSQKKFDLVKLRFKGPPFDK